MLPFLVATTFDYQNFQLLVSFYVQTFNCHHFCSPHFWVITFYQSPQIFSSPQFWLPTNVFGCQIFDHCIMTIHWIFPMHKGFKGFHQLMFWAKFWFFCLTILEKFLFLSKKNKNQLELQSIYNFSTNLHTKKMKSLWTWNHETNVNLFLMFKFPILCFNISLFKSWHSMFIITTNYKNKKNKQFNIF